VAAAASDAVVLVVVVVAVAFFTGVMHPTNWHAVVVVVVVVVAVAVLAEASVVVLLPVAFSPPPPPPPPPLPKLLLGCTLAKALTDVNVDDTTGPCVATNARVVTATAAPTAQYLHEVDGGRSTAGTPDSHNGAISSSSVVVPYRIYRQTHKVPTKCRHNTLKILQFRARDLTQKGEIRKKTPPGRAIGRIDQTDSNCYSCRAPN
jgi:hypothetical protein